MIVCPTGLAFHVVLWSIECLPDAVLWQVGRRPDGGVPALERGTSHLQIRHGFKGGLPPALICVASTFIRILSVYVRKLLDFVGLCEQLKQKEFYSKRNVSTLYKQRNYTIL